MIPDPVTATLARETAWDYDDCHRALAHLAAHRFAPEQAAHLVRALATTVLRPQHLHDLIARGGLIPHPVADPRETVDR